MANYINAFCYSAETGEFTGVGMAWESPLEPGIYLLPASATFIEPPSFDSSVQRCIFDGETWHVSDRPPEPELPTDPPQ